MKVSNSTAGRLLALTVAAAMLASCVAHGQQPSTAGLPPELRELPYWKVFRNHSSHSAAFFNELTSGRAFVFEHPEFPGVVNGELYLNDGTMLHCLFGGKSRYFVLSYDLSFETHSTGTARTLRYEGRTNRSLVFYDPRAGTLHEEYLTGHEDPHKRQWKRFLSGWVQDSWPRAMADACPRIRLPDGMEINEKQTSRNIDELRRQDTDAPIRNFPGSHMTAPGRTGWLRSGGGPTTTAEEVEAFLAAQEGNIVRWSGFGYVWMRSWDREELWRVQRDSYGEKFLDIVRSEDGSRITIKFASRDMVYPVGYPFPFLPTGHRHPAFQLTDEFLAHSYPRALPFMGEAYSDKRFVFHPEGKFSVVDEAGNLVEGPHFDGTWRWTRGFLEMTVRDDPAGFQLIHWRSLAHQLGMKPTVWTPSTPDRY